MLHKALRLIRKYHNKSPSETAFALGISKTELSEIESNQRPISPELLNKYALMFELPVSSLVLFSETVEKERKYSQIIRKSLAGKALKILEWMTDEHAQNKNKAQN
ncbi:helix-turn-helix domain-containing protein [Vibrio parahaemolyticus]|uniref:helix-turn-helix domain-containing protein n=1 Tax=Vibrio TaxID=662 RepID=UPI0004714DE8|nr:MULTISPECIES: helix-turn-helix transcriptional regulator [Vibrio]EHK7405824.1 helix-turn-helix transcriptional regulator [Vibrio parahaemolyticus]EHK7407020.1 helix-turn-helix transcriptional regulator [Vibrio parahaemolyticus]EIJ2230134.1 helix-turn-helix transcriptional regulator [Vibrio parahaemolyticus]EJC6830497.1 helix-turn-helix transcriptional regulator [Vibrio parahaemolyticus]EJE3289023.1 helix-turn-helix transcriptional regulator [Vibrio alginolyticus]